jgi:transposase
MPRRIRLQPHLTDKELCGRYRRAADPVERSHWHFLWLLAGGMTATAVAAVTSNSAYWIGQIVLVLDRAGWHASVHLRVPDHVHLLFLPAYSPELQPAKHLWPLTNTALANRHFATIEALEDVQAERCVALQALRDLIRSTALFSGGRSGSRDAKGRAGTGTARWRLATASLQGKGKHHETSRRLHADCCTRWYRGSLAARCSAVSSRS